MIHRPTHEYPTYGAHNVGVVVIVNRISAAVAMYFICTVCIELINRGTCRSVSKSVGSCYSEINSSMPSSL